jgi:branched-chain amino acid transport system substrate-binding protein
MRLTRPAAALAAVLTLTTAACGGDSGSGGGGDDGGDIVIGSSISLSGGIALPQIVDGYQMAVDEVNAAGGLDVGDSTRQVSLEVLDNRSDTNTMIQQVRSLVLEDEVVALLGSCCQQNIDMVAQADSLQVPLVMGALPVELLPETQGWAWDSFQSLADGATGFFELADQANSNKKTVIITNNDAPGVATAELWSSIAADSGYDVAVTAAEPAGTTDFSDAISQAQSADAQVLIAAMTPPDCFALWNQMSALAYEPVVAIGLQCAQTPGWAELGEVGDGTLAISHWTPTSGLSQAEQIEAEFGEKYPNVNDLASVALGYHEAMLLLQAISDAGSTEREAINEAIGNLADFESALGPVQWEDNKSVTPTFIGQWDAEGGFTQVWPAEGADELRFPVPGLSS